MTSNAKSRQVNAGYICINKNKQTNEKVYCRFDFSGLRTIILLFLHMPYVCEEGSKENREANKNLVSRYSP